MTFLEKIGPRGKIELVLNSNFANTYGGLAMIRDEDGDLFLKMDDCMGPDFHGPLTPIEAAAFTLLAEAY